MSKTQTSPAVIPHSEHPIADAVCDPRVPSSYPRRVLLAVSGLSPQIVTETVYALTQAQTPAWVPTEIHLLTTTEGANRARLSLFSNDLGWFHRLCADYGLSGIRFDASHIHVLQNASGQPMDDIRTVEDNSAAADAITAKVRELSADEHCALHVSIAGGRKSMGFYVGYALSLYGRAQDRLSHVLVSEPFEQTLDFFYPTPQSRVLKRADGRMADTKDAQVTLAHIPFVSLRHGLPEALLEGNASFNETVEAARFALAPAALHLHLGERYIVAAGKKVKLAPDSLAMLALFARRKLAGQPPLPAPQKSDDLTAPDPQWADWYLKEYKKCSGGDWSSADATRKALKEGMDGQKFSGSLTRLHQRLRKALGPAAQAYCVHDGASRPRRYALQLPASAIRFLD